MSNITIVCSKEMVKIAESIGFVFSRQKGSHKIFKSPDGKVITIPFHNEDLGRGLIRKIVSDMGITVEEYERIRKEV